MKRYILFLLAVSLLLSMTGCKKEAPVAATVATEPAEVDPLSQIDPILAERRTAAEAYMRNMCSILWSPETDILYTLQNNTTPEEADEGKQMLLHADRIYRGMPYAYAGSTVATFLEYAGESENGVYPISDLNWQSLSGNSKKCRVGNDGSSSLILSWAIGGSNIDMTSTAFMTNNRGFLPVGSYATLDKQLKKTNLVCYENGEQVMFAAYGQLLKADGLVKVTDEGGHSMMAVSSTVVYNEDGTINGDESYVILLEQSKEFFLAEEHYTDPQLGEIYIIGGVDVKYSFVDLYKNGYLPITCKAFTDTTPIKEATITDTGNLPDQATCFDDFLISTMFIDTVTLTITNEGGQVVQEAAIRTIRGDNKEFRYKRFTTEKPELMRGSFDLEALPEGKYTMTFTCRLVDGSEQVVRKLNYFK